MTDPPTAPQTTERAEALADLLGFLTLEPLDAASGRWQGPAAQWWGGEILFGGLIVAQAVMAATRQVPAGSRLHSLHAYFLRPVVSVDPVDYVVVDLRAGRSFVARTVSATQAGKAVLEMTCSLTADTAGYRYDLPLASPVPDPEALAEGSGPGPWIDAWVGPSPVRADGTRESTYRCWYRIPFELDDDVHLQSALVAFASDWTGTGGRPLDLEGDTGSMVSLDHALWLHRPARADQWLLYDVQALVNAGGRGLLRGVMRDRTGGIVASVGQELRLVPPEGTGS